MNALLAATRAVAFASALLVFGQIVFALFVARSAWSVPGHDRGNVEHRIARMITGGLVLGIVSSAVWLSLEVPLMSGEPFAEALQGPTLGIVLAETWFGRVWIVRLAAALALLAWLAWRRRGARVSAAALVLAGIYLAAPALSGHAAGGQGMEGGARIANDMLHLLAAGAWLGALPGLVLLLSAAHRSGAANAIDAAARATRRFSALGIVSVSILVATGAANAAYLVRSFASLTGSEYGEILIAKLVLVAAMIALAAVNRWRLSPRLAAGDRRSVGALARNAALETLFGIGVVAIVGLLGITVPGMHSMHHELHSDTSGAIIFHSSSRRHHG